jgi:hypothetical protein
MGPGLAVGVVVGWLAGSVAAAVVLAGAFRRLGAGDDLVMPVRNQAGASAPASVATVAVDATTAHSIDVAAVVAHALLGSMSVVAGAAHTLQSSDATLTPDERRMVMDRLVSQADHVIGVLADVARGLPPDVHDLLDDQAVTSRVLTSHSDTAAATTA